MLEWLNPISNFFMIVSTSIATISGMVWWLSKQFSSQREFFIDKLSSVQEAIVEKLEYHERHDDRRFAEVKDDIFGIQLRNAAIDGEVFVQRARSRNKAMAERKIELMKEKDKE